MGSAVRNGLFDIGTDLLQVLRQIVRRQTGLHRHHAATDIDPDRRRDDGLERRNHTAHRGADAPMHVGHRRNMTVDEGHLSDVLQLLLGFRPDRHPLGPGLYGHTVIRLINIVIGSSHGRIIRLIIAIIPLRYN